MTVSLQYHVPAYIAPGPNAKHETSTPTAAVGELQLGEAVVGGLGLLLNEQETRLLFKRSELRTVQSWALHNLYEPRTVDGK